MIQPLMEEEDTIFAVRRSTQDKLTYKNIIASAIGICNRSKGTTRFKDDVQALASTIAFNVSGYNLAYELKEVRNVLLQGVSLFVKSENQKMGKKALYHANQAKLKIRANEWYWNHYFEAILQVLAKHNLLFDTERKISVIQDSNQYDDEETV